MIRTHRTEAIVVTCIDFRFQEYIDRWLKKAFRRKYMFDRVALAGSIFDLDAILTQVDLSHSLHGIQHVILINHEDCGAYGRRGTYKRHVQDLTYAKKAITDRYPHLAIQLYYLHLDGTFEPIN